MLNVSGGYGKVRIWKKINFKQKRLMVENDYKIANIFANRSHWTSELVDNSVREFIT